MTAAQLKSLVLARHWKDLAIAEVKIGQSYGHYMTERLQEYQDNLKLFRGKWTKAQKREWHKTTHAGPVRIDVWAMRKSWSDYRCIAYEIKTSRADFLADRKYPEYWQYCNEFYFVTPPGLLSADEIGKLPPQAGLLEAYRTETGLRVRRRPSTARDNLLCRMPEGPG